MFYICKIFFIVSNIFRSIVIYSNIPKSRFCELGNSLNPTLGTLNLCNVEFIGLREM